MDGKINCLVANLMKNWNSNDYNELESLLKKKEQLLDNLDKILNNTLIINNFDIDLSSYKTFFEQN